MALFDLPLEKLRRYRSPHPEPADFDTFWRRTLADARRFPLDATFARVRARKEIRVYDFNYHEGGGPFQQVEKLRFARKHL